MIARHTRMQRLSLLSLSFQESGESIIKSLKQPGSITLAILQGWFFTQ